MLNAQLDITAWLNGLNTDGPASTDRHESDVYAWLYEDLHQVARNHMRKENPGHTLSATALTHEAWFRMSELTRMQWTGRSHFLAMASTVMRRILIHHALSKRAEKRDVNLVSLTHAENQPLVGQEPDALSVHEALLSFEAVDPRAAKVVELKFFGGMENSEIAEALGISLATVKREWSIARSWLVRELTK